MSFEDELKQKERELRGEIDSTKRKEEEFKKLEIEYRRAGLALEGHVIVDLSPDLRQVVDEALPNIKFRHKVKVVPLSDATRVIVGSVTSSYKTYKGDSGQTTNCQIYTNNYGISSVNAYAFLVPMGHSCDKNEPSENAYMAILSDGNVALSSTYCKVYPNYGRSLILPSVRADKLRENIIKVEVDARTFPNEVFTQLGPSGSSGSSSSGSSGGCYIATCVYGSYDCPEVWTLRRFRDEVLMKSAPGRAFVRTYYAVSPGVVRKFGSKRAFTGAWRHILDKMVRKLNAEGISGDRYTGD